MQDRIEAINGKTIPYDENINSLKEMLAKDISDFLVACIALGNKNEIEALEILITHANSTDWCKRRAVAEAIAYHEKGYLAKDLLLKFLSDDSQYVTRTACETVAKLGIVECHDKMIELIKQKEEYTREIALKCIISVWKDSDFDFIYDIFRNDSSKSVRDKAAYILRHKSNKNNCRIVIEEFGKGELPHWKLWACELIEVNNCSRDYGHLLVSLSVDMDGHVRKAAKKLLDNISI